jgi:hypothetical protein
MTKSAATDLVAGLVSLGWALSASLPWPLGIILAGWVHPGVAAAFGLAALGRSYAAMRGQG